MIFFSQNFVKIDLDLDPDPHAEKLLDPDPHKVNSDPQRWYDDVKLIRCQYLEVPPQCNRTRHIPKYRNFLLIFNY